MSTATLNVWITNLGDPSTIANDPGLPNPWVVAVAHCDGRVLNWSEGRYRHHREDEWTPIPQHPGPGGIPGWWYESIPTRDGHVEIELPPGSYSVIGSMHTWWVQGAPGGIWVLHGNWATDHALVDVSCGQEACVKLYAPTDMACWNRLFIVIRLLMHQNIIGQEEGNRAIEAIQAIFNRPMSPFERAEMETLERAFAQMGKEIPGQEERKE